MYAPVLGYFTSAHVLGESVRTLDAINVDREREKVKDVAVPSEARLGPQTRWVSRGSVPTHKEKGPQETRRYNVLCTPVAAVSGLSKKMKINNCT